jgi:predicted nuclease of restriction endonuclease-like RecB superfamily
LTEELLATIRADIKNALWAFEVQGQKQEDIAQEVISILKKHLGENNEV